MYERSVEMATDRHVYGEVNSKTGLKKVFIDIRHDVSGAGSRPTLTELYKRAGYLITLTYAPSWEKKFGRQAGSLRRVSPEKFRKTAQKIKSRAKKNGTDPEFHRKGGEKTMQTPSKKKH